MLYKSEITLKDGRLCTLRSARFEDGAEVFALFNRVHGETDYLLSYPDESSFDADGECLFLQRMAESENQVMLLAVLDGRIVATASVSAVGTKYKVRHRADFGISVEKDCWGLGIGRVLTSACIECARAAGYTQLELDAVGENESALALYRSAGFTEYGRNPLGFLSRSGSYQELVSMRMEL